MALSALPNYKARMNQYANIVLVGFMGTGKTSVGKGLARRLGLEFLDMDKVIVERQNKSIQQIFAENGEPFFRMLEKNLAKELSAQKGRVIATGGGIVLNPDNIKAFSGTGLVVCLTATPEAILKRVERDTTRPLLATGDKMTKITELLNARKHLYDAIPVRIDTSALQVPDVINRIIAISSGTQP